MSDVYNLIASTSVLLKKVIKKSGKKHPKEVIEITNLLKNAHDCEETVSVMKHFIQKYQRLC